MKRVAVVGSGISGLAVAHALASEAQVTLFEAGGHFGGHTHTVDVQLDGVTQGVDTGFLVFNERTYPNLIRLFAELNVATARAEMSFSVQVPQAGLEWSGNDLNGVFAQRRNLLRPRFWQMLADIVRINFPAPRGGVFAASHHSSLRSPNPKIAASGGEFTRSDSRPRPDAPGWR